MSSLPALSAEPEQNTYPLSLSEVIADIIKYNPLIEDARLEWISTGHAAKAAWGNFEPAFTFKFEENRLLRENTVEQMLQESYSPTFSERNREYDTGLSGKLFTGTTYNFGYSVTHLRNNLSELKQYESFLGFSGKQPLLKGFWVDSSLAEVEIAKTEHELSFNNFRKQLMQIISEAEGNYWNLAFAQEQYTIATESVDIARKLYADAEERLKTGKFSEFDFNGVKAELEIRLSSQSQAYQNLLDASLQLKLLLNNPDINGDHILRADDSLVSLVSEKLLDETELESAAAKSLEIQPDYLMRQKELRKEQIRLGYYKSQRLPELNLIGNYGWNGLDSTADKAWEKIETHDYPAWAIGFEMKIPVFTGIREQNELAAARINERRANERIKSMEYEISRSIALISQRLRSLKAQMETNKSAVDCRKLILEMGISRFEAGKTDILLVYDSEEKLSDSRKEELRTFIKYREAALQLKYLCGDILLDKNLETRINDTFYLSDPLITNN